MDVDLLDEDQVIVQDPGRDGGLLANQSVLTRGLVLRSRGNQLRLRLRLRRSQPASLLLRYQGKSSSAGSTDGVVGGLTAGFPLLGVHQRPIFPSLGFRPRRLPAATRLWGAESTSSATDF